MAAQEQTIAMAINSFYSLAALQLLNFKHLLNGNNKIKAYK